MFRAVHRNGKTVRALPQARVGNQLLTLPGMTEAAINNAVQRACRRVPEAVAVAYSAHSLRAGFATYAAQKGLPGHRPSDAPPLPGVAQPAHPDRGLVSPKSWRMSTPDSPSWSGKGKSTPPVVTGRIPS